MVRKEDVPMDLEDALYASVVSVDFGNTDSDGLIFARQERSSCVVGEGDLVVAGDGEGHRCPAIVAKVAGGIVFLDPFMDLFIYDEGAA